MRNIGLFVASIGVFLVVVANLYYNSITLDIQMIKAYIVESNIILEDIVDKENYVNKKKDEYISRLMTLKRGIENSHTTFLIDDYKKYKIKSIEYLIEGVSEDKDKGYYLKKATEYNHLCEKELNKLANNNITE
ncbi:hypothetical protein [Romboutsia sp.]|uniref:hypothetical protein n=1 Tax=Romboutsia sp. TaxID=1965302 RepID=UPI003F2FD6B8